MNLLEELTSGTAFDLSESASDFGTIVESDEDVVFGELVDNEPVIPTILSDSTQAVKQPS